jgi:SAM-dependent methyltransferase
MSARTHDLNVTAQFGPRAAAYVTSAVHAAGEDLKHIADLAAACKPARALDLGCGGGHVSFHVAPYAQTLVAYDLSADMLHAVVKEAAQRKLSNITPQQGSVEKLPFADASFDFVASRYSAHHWHDVRAGIREAKRVLAPGGVAGFADIVTSPSALIDTHLQAMELLRDPSHVRDYSVAEWIGFLKEAGFTPSAPTLHKVRIDFGTWIARMATPEVNVNAIRALQGSLPRDVADYFQLEPDGSFLFESMTVSAT